MTLSFQRPIYSIVALLSISWETRRFSPFQHEARVKKYALQFLTVLTLSHDHLKHVSYTLRHASSKRNWTLAAQMRAPKSFLTSSNVHQRVTLHSWHVDIKTKVFLQLQFYNDNMFCHEFLFELVHLVICLSKIPDRGSRQHADQVTRLVREKIDSNLTADCKLGVRGNKCYMYFETVTTSNSLQEVFVLFCENTIVNWKWGALLSVLGMYEFFIIILLYKSEWFP